MFVLGLQLLHLPLSRIPLPTLVAVVGITVVATKGFADVVLPFADEEDLRHAVVQVFRLQRHPPEASELVKDPVDRKKKLPVSICISFREITKPNTQHPKRKTQQKPKRK